MFEMKNFNTYQRIMDNKRLLEVIEGKVKLPHAHIKEFCQNYNKEAMEVIKYRTDRGDFIHNKPTPFHFQTGLHAYSFNKNIVPNNSSGSPRTALDAFVKDTLTEIRCIRLYNKFQPESNFLSTHKVLSKSHMNKTLQPFMYSTSIKVEQWDKNKPLAEYSVKDRTNYIRPHPAWHKKVEKKGLSLIEVSGTTGVVPLNAHPFKSALLKPYENDIQLYRGQGFMFKAVKTRNSKNREISTRQVMVDDYVFAAQKTTDGTITAAGKNEKQALAILRRRTKASILKKMLDV